MNNRRLLIVVLLILLIFAPIGYLGGGIYVGSGIGAVILVLLVLILSGVI